MTKTRLLAVAAAVLFAAGAARAETKVELKGTHLCCGACVKAAGAILKDAGVKGTCDQKAKTISIVADSDEAAQKALDALAEGGFHGTTDNEKLKQKDDSGATAGKVQSLTLTGIHNCCPQCNTAIKNTLKKVEGVKGDTAKSKETSFDVTGDFDAEAVVKALNAAGFHVKVKK